MKHPKAVFVVALALVSLLLFSCSEKNPIAPVILQTWGNYDYFGYGIHINWDYQENYPSTNETYQFRYSIFGQEFRNPHTGWQKLLIVDGQPIGYYLIHIDRNGLYYYNFSRGTWHLHYELPLIIGNRWNLTYTYDYDQQTMVRVSISREVMDREDLTVMGVAYEDCAKIKESITVQYYQADTLDSSYYYNSEEWFAPNTSSVKWIFTSTDVEDWQGFSRFLERKYGEKYEWPNRQVRSSPIELPPYLPVIPGAFKKFNQ